MKIIDLYKQIQTNKTQIKLLEVILTCLASSLLDCLLIDSCNRLNDPGRYLLMTWTAEGIVGILAHQPVGIHLLHVGFEWSIKANIDRLHKTGAACGNKLNLNTKTQNGISNTPKDTNQIN
jgi:hypothetical protein